MPTHPKPPPPPPALQSLILPLAGLFQQPSERNAAVGVTVNVNVKGTGITDTMIHQEPNFMASADQLIFAMLNHQLIDLKRSSTASATTWTMFAWQQKVPVAANVTGLTGAPIFLDRV
jgi:hypothetical protein